VPAPLAGSHMRYDPPLFFLKGRLPSPVSITDLCNTPRGLFLLCAVPAFLPILCFPYVLRRFLFRRCVPTRPFEVLPPIWLQTRLRIRLHDFFFSFVTLFHLFRSDFFSMARGRSSLPIPARSHLLSPPLQHWGDSSLQYPRLFSRQRGFFSGQDRPLEAAL